MAERIEIDPQIKEIVAIVKKVLLHILSYWYLLIIFVILAMIVGKMMKKEPIVNYIATLTFTINQTNTNNNSETNGISNLITDFSAPGTRKSKLNSSRLMELSKSNAVLTELLFREAAVEGDSNYLANHYRIILNPNVADTNFFQNFVSIDSLTRSQNATLKSIISNVSRNSVYFSVSPSQIFKITTKSTNEEFTKKLAEAYYQSLSDLYIRGAISKAQASYDFANERLKEATANMISAEQRLANWQDSKRSLVTKSAHLKETDLTRKVRIYNEVYLNALKSYESAKITLENRRPVFQLIDPPTYPLIREVTSSRNLTLFAIIGAIAFYLFITITLYLYKEYGYLLKEILDA